MPIYSTLFCGVFKFNGEGCNLSLNRLILRLTGLWYGPHPKWRTWQHIMYNLVTLWMLSLNIGLMVIVGSAAYVHRNDMVSLINVLALLSENIGGFVKVMAFVLRRRNLERVMMRLDKLSWDPVVLRGGEASRKTIAESSRTAMIVSVFFLVMYSSLFFAWLMRPVITGTGLECWASLYEVQDAVRARTVKMSLTGNLTDLSEIPSSCPPPILPADAHFFFDISRNPGYAYAFLFQLASGYYLCITTAVIDALYLSMMVYVKTILQILASDILSLKENVQNTNPEIRRLWISQAGATLSERSETKLICAMKDVIIFHTKITECVYEMQSAISVPMLAQFLSCTVSICVSLYSVSNGQNDGDTLKFGGLVLSVIIRIFFYCDFGDRVTQMNEYIVEAAYGCGWFDGPPEFKRMVLLVILRAQRTLAFRGGVFYELSRHTYLQVVNASYSYFNLLTQMRSEE